MPRSSPIQTSFGRGEVSPRAAGHVDADFYKKALRTCLNAEVTPLESVCRRPGSVFVTDLGDDSRVRLIPFPQSNGQDYLLVLAGGYLQLYSLQSQLPFQESATDLSFIVGGDFSDEGDWTMDTAGGLTDDGTWHSFAGNDLWLRAFRYSGEGGARTPTAAQTFTPANTVTATLKFVVKAYAYDDVTLRVQVTEGATVIATYSGHPSVGSTVEFPVSLVTGHTYTLDIRITAIGGGSGGTVRAGTVTLDWISLTAASTGGGSYTFDLPWTADQLAGVRYAIEPGRNRIYFVHPNVAPQFLERNPSTGAWTWLPIDFGGTGPVEWTGTNWPSIVEVYQGRLWLAATLEKGNTIWASKSLDPFDFTMNDGATPPVVTDAHAIAAPIATKGRIRWMQGRRMLLVGTDAGEYAVTASGGVVTPNDIQVRQESAFGSAAIQSIDLGDQVLYVSRDRRKVRAIDYSAETEKWASRDLTFLAEHVTAQLVNDAQFARDPNGTIVLVLGDGTLACCTYNTNEQVAAWWPADLTDPVVAATVVDGSEGSILYLAVQRASGVLLELVPMSELSSLRVYCDSAVVASVDGQDPAIVTGLGHLEGKAVVAVVDGAVQTGLVVASGQVQLEAVGATAIVGLPYTGRAVTLPSEGGNPAGTAQGAKRRRPKIIVRLNESARPLVNGERAAERSPATLMDTAEPLFTGDIEVWASTWDDDGSVTIEMDLPLRTEVLAIFGQLQVND